MPFETAFLSAAPAGLNFFFRAFQTGYQLLEAPCEISELLKTISQVEEDIQSAQKKRTNFAKTSHSDELVDLDKAIKDVDDALSSVRALVEPTRRDQALNHGQIRAWTRLMWVARDSHNVLATNSRLMLAHSRFQNQMFMSQYPPGSIQGRRRSEDGDERAFDALPVYIAAQQADTKRTMSERRQERKPLTTSHTYSRSVSDSAVVPLHTSLVLPAGSHSAMGTPAMSESPTPGQSGHWMFVPGPANGQPVPTVVSQALLPSPPPASAYTHPQQYTPSSPPLSAYPDIPAPTENPFAFSQPALGSFYMPPASGGSELPRPAQVPNELIAMPPPSVSNNNDTPRPFPATPMISTYRPQSPPYGVIELEAGPVSLSNLSSAPIVPPRPRHLGFHDTSDVQSSNEFASTPTLSRALSPPPAYSLTNNSQSTAVRRPYSVSTPDLIDPLVNVIRAPRQRPVAEPIASASTTIVSAQRTSTPVPPTRAPPSITNNTQRSFAGHRRPIQVRWESTPVTTPTVQSDAPDLLTPPRSTASLPDIDTESQTHTEHQTSTLPARTRTQRPLRQATNRQSTRAAPQERGPRVRSRHDWQADVIERRTDLMIQPDAIFD